jgi:uroporphyrinogen-III synthase
MKEDMKRSVLVTRPQPAADAMALKLQREGFEVHVAPLMMYVARPFSMPDLEGVQALVFTSAQAVDIFSAKTKVREMPVFTVGDATAKAASDAGFLRIFSASGDGDALVALMISKKETLGLKRVLHVTGEDTAKDLSRALAPSGISIGRLIVYKAEIIDRIPADVERVLLQGKITDVTLFSERAAAHFANIMRRKDFRAASANLNIICVSNRVAASIKDVPWKSVAVAAAPRKASWTSCVKRWIIRRVMGAFMR